MGVGDDDLLDLQSMLAEEREHVLNVIAGVDDHRFARGFVADDGAVAVQRPDREDFVDHSSIVSSTEYPIASNRSNAEKNQVQTCLGARRARQYANAPGRFCGCQIPSAWISGPGPCGEAAQGICRKAGPDAASTTRLQHGAKAGEYAGHARGLTLRAVRHRAAGDSADRSLPQVRLRTAFLQAVHVFRSGKTLRVHATGEEPRSQEVDAQRLYVSRNPRE